MPAKKYRRKPIRKTPVHTVTINGKTEELFYIGTLAKRLRRTPTCIRQWEKDGVIPQTWFKDKRGNRLYTKKQIDILQKCTWRLPEIHGSGVRLIAFSQRAHKRLAKLHEEYFGKGDSNEEVKT